MHSSADSQIPALESLPLGDIFEQLTDAFVLLDRDGVCIYINQQAAELVGRQTAELIGKNAWELYPKAQESPLYAAVQTFFSTRQPVTLELLAPNLGLPLEIRVRPAGEYAAIFTRNISERIAAQALLAESEKEITAQRQILDASPIARDIAEHKRAEAALRASHVHLTEILESVTDAFYAVDKEFRFTYTNAHCERIWGIPRAEALGKTILEVFPHIAESFSYRKHLEAAETRRPVRYETISPVSGLWLEVQIYPTQTGLVAYFRDITERKEREAERQYVLQSARCLLWSSEMALQEDGQIAWTMRYFDEEAAQRLVPIDSQPGDPYIWKWHAVRFPEDRQANYRVGEAAVRAGQDFQLEFRMRDREGSIHWLREEVHVETIETGRRWRSVGVCADITEQKNAESALAERAKEIETIMNAAPAAICIAHDPQCRRITGNQWAYRLMHVSPETTNFTKTGPPEENLMNFTVWREGRPLNASELPMQFAAATGNEARDWEIELRFDDGQVTFCLANAAPLFDTNGKVRGAVGAFSDITEQKHRQAEIERLNERLRRSMSETHHRVKNNLQVISAMLDMQHMQHEAVVPMAEIDRIRNHIQALSTIHDLLTQQAKTDQENNDLSVQAAMQKLMPVLQSMIVGRRNLTFAIDDLRIPVRQSTTLAVLVNELVSNALKHGKGNIHVGFSVHPEEVQLVVEDEGDGFPPGFDAETAAHTGLELVLSLARWDLDGQVSFENREEGGARTRIRFPRANTTRTKGEY